MMLLLFVVLAANLPHKLPAIGLHSLVIGGSAAIFYRYFCHLPSMKRSVTWHGSCMNGRTSKGSIPNFRWTTMECTVVPLGWKGVLLALCTGSS